MKTQRGRGKFLGLIIASGLVMYSFTSFGQSATVKGEVVDMSCYMSHDAKGPGHKKCAQSCLDKGLPAGILTSSGQVYLLVEDHSAADAYKDAIKQAAANVEITGKVVNKNGVQTLIVEKVKKEG